MLRRLLPGAVAVGLAVATSAGAQPSSPFVVLGEPCAIDLTDFNRWGGFGTNPLTVNTTVLPDQRGALCSARASLISGQTTFGYLSLPSAQSTYNLTCRMYVETMPAVETRVADFYTTASGGMPGAILSLVPIDATQYRLRASYRNEGTYVCNGSTANGTECTPSVDPECSGVDRDLTYCPETNHCEARCEERTFATGLFTAGQWITWTLQQQNGTDAEVAVRLWGGTGGYVPAAYALGGGYQTVGFCAGGASVNLACLTNSDCPASTCTTTRKVTVERVRLGKTDTGTGTGTIYYAKCLGYGGTTAYPNLMWDTLQPTSDGGRGNWVAFEGSGDVRTCSDTNLWDCLTDGARPDGRLSSIENQNAAQPTVGLNYGPVATPSPAPTPLAVAVEIEGQQTVSGTGVVDVEAITTGSSTTSDYSEFTVDFTDDGTSAAFHNLPTFVTTNSTVLANLATFKLELKRPTSTGSSRYRFTVAPASVIRQTAEPAVVESVPDRDRDGEQTVCVVGDSISDNATFQGTLASRLATVNVTNLYFCTKGGTTPLDAADDFTDIQDGDTTQFMACDTVLRGTAGRTCDVVTVMMGVNAWHGANQGPPSNLATVEGGRAQDGVCETASGSGTGQGAACRCPSLPRQRTNPARGAEKYCFTKGSGGGAFGAVCEAGADCVCASNADCSFNGTTGRCGACVGGLDQGEYCTSGATCLSGNCDTNLCAGAGFAAGDGCVVGKITASLPAFSEWCGSACDDAPGCAGLCIQSPASQMVTADFEAIETSNLAYPTPAATPPLGGRPIVVYVAEPAPQYPTGTAGTATGSGVGCWRGLKHHVESLNRWLRTWTAASATRRFIDADAWMQRHCPVRNKICSDSSCCATDDVHPNNYGQQQLAEILYRALANQDGTHDGTCTGGVCTTGKRGDVCASNADCDYYRMDLTL